MPVENTRQRELAERYSPLRRSDLPPAYRH
jgi:hypothetical protein